MNAILVQPQVLHSLDDIENLLEQNTVDRVLLFKEVHDRELWKQSYHSFDDWLLRRFGLGRNYIRNLLETQLPQSKRQLTLWDLPGDDSDIDSLLESAGNDRQALADLVANREGQHQANAAMIDEEEREDELEKRIRRMQAKIRGLARDWIWFGHATKEEVAMVIKAVELFSRKAVPQLAEETSERNESRNESLLVQKV